MTRVGRRGVALPAELVHRTKLFAEQRCEPISEVVRQAIEAIEAMLAGEVQLSASTRKPRLTVVGNQRRGWSTPRVKLPVSWRVREDVKASAERNGVGLDAALDRAIGRMLDHLESSDTWCADCLEEIEHCGCRVRVPAHQARELLRAVSAR